MSLFRLIKESLFHYRWVNLSVLAGVALTSAILSGSFVVGDSVKESLRLNAEARTARIGPIFSGGERYFTEGLKDAVAKTIDKEVVLSSVVQVEGTALFREEGKRVNRVQILGVDEEFWKLSPGGKVPPGFSDGRWVGVNEALASRIGVRPKDVLIVQLELPGALSKDAPLSGESEQTVPMTLGVNEIVDAESFGLYSLRAEQVAPSTIFVNQKFLQDFLEIPGQVNLILADQSLSGEQLISAVEASWSLQDLRLGVGPLPGTEVQQLVSSRVFFDEVIADAVQDISSVSSPVLTYLATSIKSEKGNTPYSMVAGVGPELNGIVDDDLEENGIVLSQWLADDLQSSVGDLITLDYNVVGAGRTLTEESREFRVAAILPIGSNGWDQSWTPDFPGIFDVDDLDEWEPGIPIDRDRIREKDDEFWDQYRATPKAFVSYEAATSMWGNRFGNATSIRFELKDTDTSFADQLRPLLSVSSLGMVVRDLPKEAEQAVDNSFDFGALFASMSFFLIAAALVLVALVFIFGIEQRASQIGLLLALGLTRKKVRRIFLVEASLVALAGSAVGLLFGFAYTKLALLGMSGVWKEAAAGIEFVYHLRPLSLVIAFVTTVLISIVVVFFASKRVMRVQPSQLISGAESSDLSSESKLRLDWVFFVLGFLGGLGCLFAPKVEGTMAEQGLFFGAGFLFTLAGVSICSILIRRFLRPAAELKSLGALGRQHTVRHRGRSLAVIGLMAAGVFMVTAINSFRLDGERGAERRDAGTGGFAYVGESTLPIYEDLNSSSAWEKYGLHDPDVDFAMLAFRVSDGDDASCLNLNRAQRPRLLGVDSAMITEINPFSFTALSEDGERPWRLLDLQIEKTDIPVIPGVIDQNTATYALQIGLGDRVNYETVSGDSFQVEIVGFLDTSILQGSIVISESEFIRFFPDAGGYQFFLMDGGLEETLEPAAAHLTRMFGDRGLEMRPASQRMNEFNAVQNTYLSIFSTLGGLGIFLGTLGLAIIVGRNVLERKGQLGVMQAMGFTRRRLADMVLSEHWFLHVLGVLIGLVSALIAVWPILTQGISSLPWGLLLGINGGVLIAGLLFCLFAARIVLRGNLMESIRSE